MKSYIFLRPFNRRVLILCCILLFLLIPTNGIAQVMTVSGFVFNDTDGSAGINKVDGIGISSIAGQSLYATLVNAGTGLAFTSTAIAANGSYSILVPATFNFSISISTTNYTSGTTPNASLPSGWAFNGEINNDATNSLTGNDGTTNGKVVSIPGGNETYVNFGLAQTAGIHNMSDTICSGSTFNLLPIDGTNGSVPAGVTYSWSAPGGTGFTGGSASSGSPTSISGTLVNTTNAPVIATYTVTPTSGGTIGLTFEVTITVFPTPIVAAITGASTVCAGAPTQMANATPGGIWSSGANVTINSNGKVTTLSSGGGSSLITYTVTNAFGCTNSATKPIGINYYLTINDVSLTEGNAGTKIFTFTVKKPTGIAVTFDYATSNGSATAGSDYVAASGTKTIAAGATSTTISVTVNGDTKIETDETFIVTISTATAGFTIINDSGIGTIRNDDTDCSFLSNTGFEEIINTSPPIHVALGLLGEQEFIQTAKAHVPFWNTTASDNQIEIWASGFGGVTSFTGNQFAELNCNAVGTLYQDFNSGSGGLVEISFAHRGRAGFANDMSVAIEPSPIGSGAKVVLGTFSALTTAWTVHTVSYTLLPSTGYVLSFISLPEFGASDGGNFLDAITINCPSIAGNVYNDIDGSDSPNMVDGAGLSTIEGQPLYATLVDGAGVSAGSTAVLSDGSYLFTGTYSIFNVLISTTNYGIGVNLPTASMPPGWIFNGEINNNETNSLTGNDGTANGKVVNVPVGSETNVNFGIIYQTPYIYNLFDTICSGSSFNIVPVDSVDGFVPAGVTYSWLAPDGTGFTGGAASSGSVNSISGSLVNATNAPVTASYTVTPTFNSSACSTFVVEVTVKPLPTVAAITGFATVCVGSTIQLADSIIGGAWASHSPAIATVDASTGLVTGLTAGTATIAYFVNINGCTGFATKSVTVYALPAVGAITGTSTMCVGSTTQLTDTTGGGVWSSGTPAVASISASGLVTGVTAGTDTITYTVTNSNGCTSFVTKEITVNALPATPVITGTVTVCIGNTTQLTGTTIGGSWYSDPTDIATVSPPTMVDPGGLVTGLAAGTATITYTVSNGGGCSSFVTKVITVSALPVVGAITGTATMCVGSTTQLADTTGGGVWSSGTPAIATVNASTGLVTGLAAGTATITYTVSNGGGCTSFVTKAITVSALPVVGAITGTSTMCVGSTTQLADTTGGGVWSSGTPAVATINAGGLVTGIKAGTATITYTVSNGGGCTSSATRTVTVYAIPSVGAITGTSTMCVGSTTQLADTTSGGIWSSGTPAVATINAGGLVTGIKAGTATITYTVSNGGGCTSSATIEVNVNTCFDTDLSVVETINNTIPAIGEVVIFTIVGTNKGPDNATGTTINVLLPDGYTFVSTSTTIGTYDPITGVWTIGNLNNGETVTLTISATVNATGNYSMTAVIQCIEQEATLVNNVSTVVLLPTDFSIPGGYSPNDDGVNDLFIIRGIENYPKNRFTIFNRWGNKVFEASPYLNTWDGRSTMGIRVGGDLLPSGTYFYVLTLGKGLATYKGTISLER